MGFGCFEQIDEKVQREIINHRSLRHPNIVRFKEVCDIMILIYFVNILSCFGLVLNFIFQFMQVNSSGRKAW